MPRTFAYVRVSTFDQTTDNQILEIKNMGFEIPPHRIISETVSGSVPVCQRKQFSLLLHKLEEGDTLVVSKIDRLGRDAIDITSTIRDLEKRKIKVHCLCLGNVDLTSAAGKMQMFMMTIYAEFERDRLRERTNAGLARAKAQGKRLGRPPALTDAQKQKVIEKLKSGDSVASLARAYNTSRMTIIRIKKTLIEE